MRKRQWLLLAVSCLAMILIVVSIVRKPDRDREIEDTQSYETEAQNDDNLNEESASVYEQPENNESESGRKGVQGDEGEAIQFDLKAIESFMEKSKMQELKKQILSIMPEGAKSVSCLDYQKASVEDMDVTCYLFFDTGQIAEVYYSFSQGTTEVKMSALTEGDITAMEDSERAAVEESERKAKEEAERRLEKERKKAEKKKAKETESETESETEGEASG